MAKQSGPKKQATDTPELSLVCPVFNEVSLVEKFATAASAILENASEPFEIVFVDDGSTDGTWEEIIRIGQLNPRIRALRLSKNFGKEIALTAGLGTARGRAHIPIDVDFQDPIDLIPEMITHWHNGFDQVIPKRIGRGDRGLRVIGARIFYKFIGWLTSDSVPKEVGDFRLLDASFTDRFLAFTEKRRVNKVIFSELGGNQKFIDFVRPDTDVNRQGGQSLSKLVDLGIAAVASNSARLSRAVLSIGIIGLILGLTLSAAVLTTWWLGVIEVPGQATVLMVGTVIVSIQLISASFLGIVIAESLRESQNRPLYFVDEVFEH